MALHQFHIKYHENMSLHMYFPKVICSPICAVGNIFPYGAIAVPLFVRYALENAPVLMYQTALLTVMTACHHD
jgi:hypothetical protein